MTRMERRVTMRDIAQWAGFGLMLTGLALFPSPGCAEESWTPNRPFGLQDSAAEDGAVPGPSASILAALTPGSVLIAQTAGAPPGASTDGWRFTIAPYLWMPRTKMSLDVGQFSQSTTIDFVDVVPQLHFAFSAHAEAAWREWTGFLDLFYMSIGQSEAQNGISTSINLQQMFFEFGAMYRLGPVSLGRAGRLAFEPLAGGRFMWLDTSLGFPNQKVSDSASLIDPMVGGRITYHITDTVALWFRGDVAGFGLSDNQSNLTYNLVGGLDWRFRPNASALVGWRYINVDIEKGGGARTFNADIEMNGPFLGLSVHF